MRGAAVLTIAVFRADGGRRGKVRERHKEDGSTRGGQEVDCRRVLVAVE